MGSKMANSGPHAAGIFADMTVDGPEIGTLVMIVDRAKNLPNRKTMGKQNPYCAARLGKEARKTETDRRGGQVPRWDQELRFTVHDSPDYYQLKLSVFSEDKKTDLIGEAWVSLDDVIVPGGGKRDVWQGLNCKGKYAGEIRIELTYYDSREKPEKAEHIVSIAEELQQTYGNVNRGVKRRPLPTNPNAPSTTNVVIPDRAHPGRAKHGPRDLASNGRTASLPGEGSKTYNYPHSQKTLFGNSPVNGVSHGSSSAGATPAPGQPLLPDPYYGEYDPNLGPQLLESQDMHTQPDFLPSLGPSRRERELLPQAPRNVERLPQPPAQHYAESHSPAPSPLSHSHSAPVVPSTRDHQAQYDQGYQLRTDVPEPIHDVNYQYEQIRHGRHDPPAEREQEFNAGYSDKQPYFEDEFDSPPPPPPPLHSHSSPAVPYYGTPHSHPHDQRGYDQRAHSYAATPPSTRLSYMPSSSPAQNVEPRYGQQQTPPNFRPHVRGHSFDDYGERSMYQSNYGSMPNLTPPHQTTPQSQIRTPPYGRQHPGRHSMQDIYTTPSRPHPLSQQVPRARSPNPYAQQPPLSSPYQHDYRGRDPAPLSKPRAASPLPPSPPSHPDVRRKSSYNIQHPVRAFESSDENPLSTSQRPGRATAHQGSVPRKSVSPRPSMPEASREGSFYSPDSFGVHNPNAAAGESPTHGGPIVGWNGQEIDPSDHLPVNSWAPEPEKKTPTKVYGMGRDRDFGPRSQAGGVVTTAGRVSKDTVINVRRRQQPETTPEPPSSKIRARVVQRPNRGSVEPLRDHENFNPVPNPYEQQHYTRGFREGSSPVPGMDYSAPRYDEGYGPPSIPPKVPIPDQNYGPDALSREISSIDIGASRRGVPTAFVPVRSHRDRNSHY